MKASHTRFRRAALCIALGACFAATTPVVFAQSATGAVAGRASAGDQVTITNEATGASRTATVGADGTYRLNQLPIGNYSLQATRGGQSLGDSIAVAVQLGGTTTVNLGGDGSLVNLDAVQVVGSRVVNRVDVYSTESATNIRREELARLPVDQSLSSVALLAPGVVRSRPGRGGFRAGIAATFVAHIVRVLVRDVARRVDASGFRLLDVRGSGHTCHVNGPLHPPGTDPLQRTQRDEVLALHIRRCGRHGGVAPRVRDGFVDDIVRTRQTQDLCATSGCRP